MILQRRSITVLGIWLMLLFPVAVDADSYGFTILRAELIRVEPRNAYGLSANIDYHFSEPAIEALRNGVSLGLVLHIKINKETGWWWEGSVFDEKISYRIFYHSMSKLYQIVYENNEPPRNFVSFNALLDTMGSVRVLPVLQSNRLQTGGRYRASLNVSLDIESLPLPLRPVAYVNPAWHLSSPNYLWTFVN